MFSIIRDESAVTLIGGGVDTGIPKRPKYRAFDMKRRMENDEVGGARMVRGFVDLKDTKAIVDESGKGPIVSLEIEGTASPVKS